MFIVIYTTSDVSEYTYSHLQPHAYIHTYICSEGCEGFYLSWRPSLETRRATMQDRERVWWLCCRGGYVEDVFPVRCSLYIHTMYVVLPEFVLLFFFCLYYIHIHLHICIRDITVTKYVLTHGTYNECHDYPHPIICNVLLIECRI